MRPTAPRDELAMLLGGRTPPLPAAGVVAPPVDGPVVRVEGVGDLGMPVTPAQARALCALSRSAPFGLGEQTVVDESVRRTWQVPLDLVDVDWDGGLTNVLDACRDVLGLPEGSELAAELHSMLVYEKGHFFAPHQDSEKDDAMVASLVVTLPSAHTGGELVVHDGERPRVFAGSRTQPTLVAFYADRRHEVRPVRSGRRVTLTYNLLLRSRDGRGVAAGEPELDERLADLLRRHFGTTPEPRWAGDERTPPTRLGYLLDHEYTQRGLTWSRLKGVDIGRVERLRVAAARADCDVLLALAEIHETWEADEWDDRGWDDDEEWEEEPDDVDGIEVGALIDSEITLSHWRGEGERTLAEVSLALSSHEVCATTPSSSLTPVESEYEGYMGNYGNTLDRWYRRALVLLWPRHLGFGNRAEATPAWALADLHARLRAGRTEDVTADVESLAAMWGNDIGTRHASADLLEPALVTAALLEDPQVATRLLAGFRLDSLSPDEVPALRAVVQRHGRDLVDGVVQAWFLRCTAHLHRALSADWVERLPTLCRSLRTASAPDDHVGHTGRGEGAGLVEGAGLGDLAGRLVGLAWTAVRPRVQSRLDADPTSRVLQELADLAPVVTALLEASAVTGSEGVAEEVVETCCRSSRSVPLVLPVLRQATRWTPLEREVSRCGELAAYAKTSLRGVVAAPVRDADDWAITPPRGCGCELCERLGGFLTDPVVRVLDWPLAAPKRRHIHTRIDATELPVTHRTRRTGRPFTLVLTKTAALHAREQEVRARARYDLDELEAAWPGS